ncbi:MAG: hypothetical protein NTZ61_19015 [Proteobacteria bacterium]|nr:hypothetical protein [Pseudomonadota bacterium]
MRRGVVLAAVAIVCGIAVAGSASRVHADERVELIPDEKAGWSPSHLFSFMRSGYYSDRTLRIESSPPGAKLDLAYVRASFQKRHEQAVAPVTVVLPTRADAGKRDYISISAVLDGYRRQDVQVNVRGDQDEVVLDLQPLPNTLVGVAHTYFAGREGITFLTKVPAQVRLQKGTDSFTVVLTQTAREGRVATVLEGMKSPLVEKVESNQLGEDLMLQVKLTPGHDPKNLELRARESQDTVRGLYRYTIDIGGGGDVERARSALGSIGSGDVTGCAASFDDALRRNLDREQLARALSPRGDFTDPYVRAALRRLGEVSAGGVIRMEDGSAFRPGIPIELAAAGSQAASAKGFLALLHAWVRILEPPEYRTDALRSLVAPEMDRATFAKALAAANAASCGGTTAGADAGPG